MSSRHILQEESGGIFHQQLQPQYNWYFYSYLPLQHGQSHSLFFMYKKKVDISQNPHPDSSSLTFQILASVSLLPADSWIPKLREG